jgi:uncharacterized SAM-binding protein YcdF (DUF218 family)
MARQLTRALRRLVRVLAFTSILLTLALVAACPFAGRYLIVDMPLEKADALVLLAGGNTGRWLEGADLYREGYARHLLLSPGYPDPVGDRLRAQGIRYPSEAQVMKDVYSQLGVPASQIEIMPSGFDNTADEAAGARRIAVERGWKSIIVVSAKYHTRRALYAFQREFEGSGITVQVKGSRHEHPQPDGWWRHRSDLRWVLSETQRLVAYRLGLGR